MALRNSALHVITQVILLLIPIPMIVILMLVTIMSAVERACPLGVLVQAGHRPQQRRHRHHMILLEAPSLHQLMHHAVAPVEAVREPRAEVRALCRARRRAFEAKAGSASARGRRLVIGTFLI